MRGWNPNGANDFKRPFFQFEREIRNGFEKSSHII